MKSVPSFELQSTDGGARAGMLRTGRGDVPTPFFMPVATQGSVRAVDPVDLRAAGAQIVLGNTYHLYLRPGTDLLEQVGGLHAFMGWDGPALTDSGGFQGFSLEHLRKVDEDGILFKSHIDGSMHKFTPESTIEAQEKIGADIIMPLDMCVAADSSMRDGRVGAGAHHPLGGAVQRRATPRRPDAVRDRPRRAARRPAKTFGRGDHVHRIPRLRSRRTERRRVQAEKCTR